MRGMTGIVQLRFQQPSFRNLEAEVIRPQRGFVVHDVMVRAFQHLLVTRPMDVNLPLANTRAAIRPD